MSLTSQRCRTGVAKKNAPDPQWARRAEWLPEDYFAKL